MKNKSINSKLKQKPVAKELGLSDSTIERDGTDIKMNIPFRPSRSGLKGHQAARILFGDPIASSSGSVGDSKRGATADITELDDEYLDDNLQIE